ncbi:hypothetical protein EC973_003541 [Apophysomyces ossiformis]|uniref:Uncharacterized protein n=1 Tax=Apophysomyces ossiformis TaxID=679940 RepID=A0A8H7BH41_9FUNG|nr:hypothetical protein EC973_003541 [Apophysomyces ossiformis]
MNRTETHSFPRHYFENRAESPESSVRRHSRSVEPARSVSRSDSALLRFCPSIPSSMSIASWAGWRQKERREYRKNPSGAEKEAEEEKNAGWEDVYCNVKRMDQMYDATFCSWLKSEDNVLVTAMYLYRIANEYPLERIANALKWLVSGWRWESTSILVRQVTIDWRDEMGSFYGIELNIMVLHKNLKGDYRRAYLLRALTQDSAMQFTATLITAILATPPYVTCSVQRERFLRAFTQDWDFSRLSEFFMYLQSRANVDYKLKCIMLQETARREREILGIKLNRKKTKTADDNRVGSDKGKAASRSSLQALEEPTGAHNRHHRRTSSNNLTDIKRLRLTAPNAGEVPEEEKHVGSSASVSGITNPPLTPSPSTSSNSNSSRRSVTSSHLSSLAEHSLGNTNISSEFSHLHLSSTAAAAAGNINSPSSSTSPFSNVHAYSSHCHRHSIRRLSSSSGSTCSTTSSTSGSSCPANIEPDDQVDSSIKKRNTSVTTTSVAHSLAKE